VKLNGCTCCLTFTPSPQNYPEPLATRNFISALQHNKLQHTTTKNNNSHKNTSVQGMSIGAVRQEHNECVLYGRLSPNLLYLSACTRQRTKQANIYKDVAVPAKGTFEISVALAISQANLWNKLQCYSTFVRVPQKCGIGNSNKRTNIDI